MFCTYASKCTGYLLWPSEQHKGKTSNYLLASNDMESNNENEQFNVKDAESLEGGREADQANEAMILAPAVYTPLPDTPEDERSERSKHEAAQRTSQVALSVCQVGLDSAQRHQRRPAGWRPLITEENMRNGKTNRIAGHWSDEGRWAGEVQISTSSHHNIREVSLAGGKDHEQWPRTGCSDIWNQWIAEPWAGEDAPISVGTARQQAGDRLEQTEMEDAEGEGDTITKRCWGKGWTKLPYMEANY